MSQIKLKNQWLIGCQISLVVIARFYAPIPTLFIHSLMIQHSEQSTRLENWLQSSYDQMKMQQTGKQWGSTFLKLRCAPQFWKTDHPWKYLRTEACSTPRLPRICIQNLHFAKNASSKVKEIASVSKMERLFALNIFFCNWSCHPCPMSIWTGINSVEAC